MPHQPTERLPSPFTVGLLSRCPRCGEGHLFSGYLQVAHSCDACGQSFEFAQSTEGPAVFIILIVGFIIVGAAAVVESLFHPAPFVHLILWLPATVVLSMSLLRPFKATLIALQFQNRAEEGRLDE